MGGTLREESCGVDAVCRVEAFELGRGMVGTAHPTGWHLSKTRHGLHRLAVRRQTFEADGGHGPPYAMRGPGCRV